ncbi:LuxR C-terminal-related transcriptional regulator [Marivita sp.]
MTRSLNLTESTVKLRVRSLCKKLGAANRTQALVLAQRQGFLS